MKIYFCEDNTIKCCGGCEHTDGLIYTSYPPKVFCMITNEFHHFEDICNVNNFNQEKDD